MLQIMATESTEEHGNNTNHLKDVKNAGENSQFEICRGDVFGVEY
jgi:hypothetical protein